MKLGVWPYEHTMPMLPTRHGHCHIMHKVMFPSFQEWELWPHHLHVDNTSHWLDWDVLENHDSIVRLPKPNLHNLENLSAISGINSPEGAIMLIFCRHHDDGKQAAIRQKNYACHEQMNPLNRKDNIKYAQLSCSWICMCSAFGNEKLRSLALI